VGEQTRVCLSRIADILQTEGLGLADVVKATVLMLELGRASVTEVAFRVGYGHVANFSTAFKRTFGVSPQMMRKDIQTDTPRRAASSRDT